MDSARRPGGDFCRRRGLAVAPTRLRPSPACRQPAIRAPKARKAQQRGTGESCRKPRLRRRRWPKKSNQEVNTNLDSLKDTLLRIELRRQAGTISDEEYARERGRAEQMLRDLVQG